MKVRKMTDKSGSRSWRVFIYLSRYEIDIILSCTRDHVLFSHEALRLLLKCEELKINVVYHLYVCRKNNSLGSTSQLHCAKFKKFIWHSCTVPNKINTRGDIDNGVNYSIIYGGDTPALQKLQPHPLNHGRHTVRSPGSYSRNWTRKH